MKNKIVLLLSFSLSIIFLISCGGGQKENVQEAKINTQGKKFVCVSTTSLIYDTSNEEEPVEEYCVTEDTNGDTIKEKMVMTYPEFQQDYASTYTYRYDDKGNKIKATCDIETNGKHSETEMDYVNTYDDNGHLIKVETENMLYEYENGQMIQLTMGKESPIITRYDNGKVVCIEQYDGEALRMKESYTYDAYGVKSTYEYYSSVPGEETVEKKVTYNIEYEYNDDGYIKQITVTSEENDNKEVYSYDEYGNNILIEYYDQEGFRYQTESFEYVEIAE